MFVLIYFTELDKDINDKKLPEPVRKDLGVISYFFSYDLIINLEARREVEIEETKKLWTYLEIIVKSYLHPTSFIKMTSGTISFKFNIETIFFAIKFSELDSKCRLDVKNYFDSFSTLYNGQGYAITPYVHMLGHLADIQTALGCVIGYYQNSCM